MPKPKFTPWERSKRNKIEYMRKEAGYNSAEAFANEVTRRGLKLEKDAYLRRERGETPVPADEIWYYSDVLGLPLAETLELFSRKPNAV